MSKSTSKREDGRWRRFQAITLALEGMHSPEISRITGLTRANIMQVCCRAGVKMATREPRETEATRAVMAVASGACVIDAAADHGVPSEVVHRFMRKRGISSKRTGAGRKDGRSRRAVKAVLFDGVSPMEAARRERVSRGAVYVLLKRIKESLER